MLKKTLLAVAVLLAVFLVVVATQPDRYHVERSRTVSAPAEVVYAQISDFRAWNAWSPWANLDPNMTKSFEGEPGTVGSSYSWSGNDDVGSGKMTVTEVKAPSSISLELEFIEPFESTASNGFKIAPAGSAMNVTWWMDGNNDFMGKLFGMFMDMDALIGADFERGLAKLEVVSESAAEKQGASPTSTAEPAVPVETAQVPQPAPSPSP